MRVYVNGEKLFTIDSNIDKEEFMEDIKRRRIPVKSYWANQHKKNRKWHRFYNSTMLDNWIWPSRSDEETDVLSVKRSCVGFSYFMSWQNSDCISPVRKVSVTMDFAEMCVTRLEQELCTQNFFFHSLSWWSIMKNKIKLILGGVIHVWF